MTSRRRSKGRRPSNSAVLVEQQAPHDQRRQPNIRPGATNFQPVTFTPISDRVVNQMYQNFGPQKNPDALYSPGAPIKPIPGLTPITGPRVFQYQPGTNIAQLPRATEQYSFADLRALASMYDGIQMCQQVWFDYLSKLELLIEPLPSLMDEQKDISMYADDIQVYQDFFAYPDKEHDLHEWLCMAVRDQLTIDAVAMYVRKDRAGRPYALDLLDASLIKPLIDDRGRRPLPPFPAYEQFVYGVPACFLTSEDLIYIKETTRSDSVYGVSRVERIILRVNQALRKQTKDLARFTDGTIPTGILKPSMDVQWSQDEIEAYEMQFNNLLAGNDEQRARVKVLPRGFEYQATDAPDIQSELDTFLLNVTAACHGLTMDELAMTDNSNRAVGQSQENVVYRRAMGPLISRYSKILTHILRKYFKENRFLVKFRGYEETEDFNAQATAYSTLSNAGIISPSRAAHLMHLPVDIDLPSPIIVTKTGPILLEDFANPELRKAQMEAQMAGLQLAKQNPGGAQPQNDDGNEDEEDNENAPQSPNQKKSAKSAAPTKPAQKTAQDDNEDDDGDGEKDTPPKRYSRADLERLLAPYKIDLDEVFREERPPQPVAQSGIWRKGSCPCEECTTNDGAIRKIGESYPSGATQPGGHASCDCTVEPVTEEEQQRAMALEYKRWRGRALDDVKAGKPFRGFTTTIIPSEMHHAIETEVHRCTTADEVRTVFQRVKDEESFFVGAAVSGGQQSLLQRYNHNHDAKGRFAAGSGGDSGGSGGGGGSGMAAKSKAAQLRALEKEMATKHPDTHFDFTGTDPAVMGPVCQQLDHLMTKYPEVGQSLAYIGTGKNAPEGYGAENLAPLGMACTVARRAGSTPYASIVLNKDEFGNASSMNAEVQKCVASAWLANGAAAGGAQYLITHEFGHVVDAYLATAGRNAQVGNVYDVATAAYTFSGNSTRMGNKVSGYAQSGGPVEMFAEGFASLHFAPPAQQAAYTKRLGALLDKVLPGGSSSSWQTRV